MFKLYGEGFGEDQLFATQSRLLTTLYGKPFKNWGKGENAVRDKNHHFSYFYLSSANASNLNQAEILSFGKG